MSVTGLDLTSSWPSRDGENWVRLYTGGYQRMICDNCGIRPASVQVFQQQGGQRISSYLCTQCARELGMIGGGTGGFDPFAMLQNLVQQQQGGAGGSPFQAPSRGAPEG